jgi:hypothetical protein
MSFQMPCTLKGSLTKALMVTAVAVPFSFNALASTNNGNQAQAPTLKINGYTSLSAAMASQTRKENGAGGTDPHVAIGGSDLYFTVSGKSANGMEYRYRINFQTIPGSSTYVNKNYVELSGGFGTLQAGALTGPVDTMPESGMSLIGGANGIDGGMNGVYNYSSGVISGASMIGESKRATKVVFYSPEVLGFQLGIAFTPNTSHMGDGNKQNSIVGDDQKAGNQIGYLYYDRAKAPYGRRNMELGLTYKGSVEKWSYAFSATAIRETTQYTDFGTYQNLNRIPMNNARSYQLTAAVGYDQWRVATGYIDNGKSRLPKDNTIEKSASYMKDAYLGNSGKAWNVGASYTVGAYQFATAYHRTDRKTDATQKASSDIVATSVDLSALQGLKFFGEVDLVRTRTNAKAMENQQAYLDNVEKKGNKAIGNNSGAVFILGTKMSF